MTTTPSSRRHLPLVLAVAASAVFAAGLTAIAVPRVAPAAPPTAVVATVNLEEVVKNLTERASLESALKAFSDEKQAELNRLVAEINNLSKNMDTLSDAEKETAAARLIEMNTNAKVKKELYEALIDQRRGKTFKALYEKIIDTTKRLAQRNGYTIVFSSDETALIPRGPSNDIERAISLKRFLYVEKGHDITLELVTMMNNEFMAAGGNK
jgi:Skp family chaperone for outer membrane proteins